jgi:hypothetical protein
VLSLHGGSTRPSKSDLIAKSSLLHVVCHRRRRNDSSLGVVGDRCFASSAFDVAGPRVGLVGLVEPPAPKEGEQDEDDAAADGAANNRPRRIRAAIRRGIIWITTRTDRVVGLGVGQGDGLGAAIVVAWNYRRVAHTEVIFNCNATFSPRSGRTRNGQSRRRWEATH